MKKKILMVIITIIGFILCKDIPGVLYVLVNADTYQVYTGYPSLTDEYIANINTNYFTSLGLQSYNRASVKNCSASNTCTGSITFDVTSGGIVWKGTMANYGFDIAHDTQQIITSNHLYSYTYNFCVPGGVSDWNNRIFIGSGLGSGRANEQTLIRFDFYGTDMIEWLDYDQSGANRADTTTCYTMYNLFNYTGSNANTMKINLITSAFSNRYIGILGYKLEDLGATNGLTTSQVENIISNSGLATATDIRQVESSINRVQQEINDVNDTLTEDHTYNNNASENISGQNELDDLDNAESNLINNLDFSGASNVNVTINPNASTFIWQIVENLRQMNSSIVILMTSILGLGILKLILNR